MKIHILGICGTFMGGVALIARELGHEVSGSDLNVYPPMSDTLMDAGIVVKMGYEPNHIDPDTDVVIIGNGISRDNPCVDYLLNQRMNYISGPQWMCENVLRFQQVIAVSGTHGKTTTTALLSWILEVAGLNPGFLIGGVPKNFSETSRIGDGKYFVIEADEYDTAFYDKRSKFLHYRPNTLIVNNLEYDHADIFPDMEAIKKQFQILLRTVPSNGAVVFPSNDRNISDVLSRGCWSKKISTGDEKSWQANLLNSDGSHFECLLNGEKKAEISWMLVGDHNIQNALAAIAAADSIGIPMKDIAKAFASFQNVKRRLEVRGIEKNVTVYDDFAHHPTAIALTIDGLRKKVGNERIIVVAQMGSNSMRTGAHRESLSESFDEADEVHVLDPKDPNWNVSDILKPLGSKAFIHTSVSDIVSTIAKEAKPHDHILVMSNKGFEGIHDKILDKLKN